MLRFGIKGKENNISIHYANKFIFIYDNSTHILVYILYMQYFAKKSNIFSFVKEKKTQRQ